MLFRGNCLYLSLSLSAGLSVFTVEIVGITVSVLNDVE